MWFSIIADKEGIELQPIFITIDPERDSKEVVGKYVKEFSDKIIGLTGTGDQIKNVCHAFNVYFKKGTPDATNDYIVSVILPAKKSAPANLWVFSALNQKQTLSFTVYYTTIYPLGGPYYYPVFDWSKWCIHRLLGPEQNIQWNCTLCENQHKQMDKTTR